MVPTRSTRFPWTIGVLAAASLSACGGGSTEEVSVSPPVATSAGSGTAASPSPAPAPAPTSGSSTPSTPTAPTPGSGTSSGSATGTVAGVNTTCGLAGFQAEVLNDLNRRRAQGAVCGSDPYPPVGQVAWNNRLTQSAYGHSLDMATANYFSHTSLSGATLSQRVDAQGYDWSTVGENIAAGYSSVASVMQGWMNSPGHCRNMMNAQFSEIGMACAKSSNSTYGSYYTLNFGRPR